ncbi:GIY-YIG nuclease family protein [Natronorubrum halophilum]|uniref:GIY-YIG nuclease family protein n=1 Tax=Natronorubrum halophilum TaxID=1702106 RepID=UPI000EF66A56|nr:GIY-YIG nuclease family protein [Natronorubrum halophilum]
MALSKEMLEAYGRKELDKYTHWVYALNCRNTYRTFDELERKAENRLGDKPWWLRQAFEANRLYYIGQTENLEKRIGQHFKNQNSSDFTTLFGPAGIERLEPVHSRNSAEYTEKQLHEAWKDVDDWFVYSK